ncbi:MAG: AAA family ATPase [Simkaniaceae bacterium]|nr:AAA family ATPase [Simkaniaceae bacterium]
MSHIILLNGPSSSGKTTIQKALQEIAPESYLRIGIDTFFDALIEEPDLSSLETEGKFDQYTPQGEYIRGVEQTKDIDGKPIVTLKIGPAGYRIIQGMHRAIAAYCQIGNNLIVDYILYQSEWLSDLKESLKGCTHHFIKVDAPLETIEEREIARSTSPPGHARSHYHTVHNGMEYELELNTLALTPEECARKILEIL